MLFRKQYTVRHYGPQSFTDGYAAQSFSDSTVSLDIQPDADALEAPEEGATTVTRINAWGNTVLTAANQAAGVRGDRVYWHGSWYECTSCVNWDGTPLCHYKATFTIVPNGGEDA